MPAQKDKFPHIKIIQIDGLIPYARNSRTHSDEQITQIAASIKEFGFLNPVIIDGENGIIAGHGRVVAAKKLGMTELPCVEADHLTEAQRRAYVIADNKLALNAGWDYEALRVELEDLAHEGFNMDLTGFDNQELLKILGEGFELDEFEEKEIQNTDDKFQLLVEYPNENELQKAFDSANGKGLPCKIIQ